MLLLDLLDYLTERARRLGLLFDRHLQLLGILVVLPSLVFFFLLVQESQVFRGTLMDAETHYLAFSVMIGPLVGTLVSLIGGENRAKATSMVALALIVASFLGAIWLSSQTEYPPEVPEVWRDHFRDAVLLPNRENRVLCFKFGLEEVRALSVVFLASGLFGAYQQVSHEGDLWRRSVLLSLVAFSAGQVVLGYDCLQICMAYQVVGICTQALIRRELGIPKLLDRSAYFETFVFGLLVHIYRHFDNTGDFVYVFSGLHIRAQIVGFWGCTLADGVGGLALANLSYLFFQTLWAVIQLTVAVVKGNKKRQIAELAVIFKIIVMLCLLIFILWKISPVLLRSRYFCVALKALLRKARFFCLLFFR